MKKISTNNTNGLLIKFVLNVIISSILSILLLSYLSSQVIYRLDLDLDNSKIFGIIICALSSVIISFISVSGLKNNGLIMGIISVIPLIFYSLMNLIFNNENVIFFIIKLFISLLIGALIGLLRTNKNKKFKVK
jgi:hypothetical protein